MSVGKYSPTVSAAYAADRDWHRKLCKGDWVDDEGYDSYGYHKHTDKDRAGWSELDYLSTFEYEVAEYFSHSLYEHVGTEWTFDGVRPVKRK
jgi:hypothetical protein